MERVVDANVVISALVADSKTRELVVTLQPDLFAPEVIHEEVETHEDLVVEKSGLDRARVRQFVDLLFQHIETVPVREFYPHIERADEAIGDTDPDDVLYLACALARDAGVWSDDSDLDEQNLVPSSRRAMSSIRSTRFEADRARGGCQRISTSTPTS